MKLRWLGHACFQMIFQDGRSLVTDPFDESVGYPLPRAHADIVTMSHGHHDHNCVGKLRGPFRIINTVGLHEIGNIQVTGIPCFHDDRCGALRGTNLIFVIRAEGLKIAHMGDLGHMPDDKQLSQLTGLDLLLIPVGGYYTIDNARAAEIVRILHPAAAVPMHYKTAYTDYPIAEEAEFMRLTDGKRASHEIEIMKAASEGKTRVLSMCCEE